MNVAIKEISTYIPESKVSNQLIEKWINKSEKYLPDGILNKLFGVESRRFAAKNQQVSDLATLAARPILDKIDKSEIDLLIFASACSDLIEPATSNIVQSKLGLECPCMDIKNACNSFLSAIHTASAFIQSGIYKNVLIVNGEKLSDAINFNILNKAQLKRSLASLSLGDAGVAALITEAEEGKGIFYQKFLTKGEHWDLCTIKGGGSMFPHDVSKNYFEGKTAEMAQIFIDQVTPFSKKCFEEANWNPKDIDHLITHQVSTRTFDTICDQLGIESNKNISVFETHGNTAAASIPLAVAEGIKNKFMPGDKIAILGFAAGISASVQLINW